MTDSPFSDFANTIITFNSVTSTGGTDPHTGNRVFVPGNPIVIQAMMKYGSGINYQATEGVDQAAVLLTGRMTDPMVKSANLTINMRGTCSYRGRNGQFVLQGDAQSIFGVEEILGERITGWFLMEVPK